MRTTGGGSLGRCSQELNFGHAKFEKTIRTPRFANFFLHNHSLHIYHESDGFVLKLDYISCMLLKLQRVNITKGKNIKAKTRLD